MNLFSHLEQASPLPDKAALLLDGRAVPYGSLFARIRSLGDRLAAAGVRQGDCVGIALANPAGYLCTVLALVRLGAVVSPFDPRWPAPMQQAIARRHRMSALVVDEAGAPAGLAVDTPTLPAQALFSDAPDALPPSQAALEAGALPWHYTLSSGTTGMPKTVVRAQSASLALLRLRGAGPPADARVMLLNPFSMIWMLHAAMEVLRNRATLVLSSGFAAETVFARMASDAPTHLVCSTDAATKLAWYRAQHRDRHPQALRHLQAMEISGSRLSGSAQALLCAEFTRHVTVMYGSSETGAVSRLDADQPQAEPGHSGQLYPGVQAHAVGPDGQALQPGAVGRLRIRSPGMSMGYLGADGALQPFDGGWFLSSDIGSVDAARQVCLTGRASEVLNLAGRKVDPDTVERELEQHPDIREAAVVAAAVAGSPIEVLVALVVSQREIDIQAIRSFLQGRLPADKLPDFATRVASLPRNAMGKLMRDQLAGLVTVDARP